MNEFWQGPTYKIVQAMKATGNRPGLIQQWKEMVEYWAQHHPGPEADAVKAWLPSWQVRQLYSAEELAPIMPALAVALRITDRLAPAKSPARLANELGYANLPYRYLYDQTFFAVERLHFWRKALDYLWLKEIRRE
jgi:hypothetical protein